MYIHLMNYMLYVKHSLLHAVRYNYIEHDIIHIISIILSLLYNICIYIYTESSTNHK